MKDRDYILATDLRTIYLMLHMLRDIVPENNPAVTAEDFKTIYVILRRWEKLTQKALGIQ